MQPRMLIIPTVALLLSMSATAYHSDDEAHEFERDEQAFTWSATGNVAISCGEDNFGGACFDAHPGAGAVDIIVRDQDYQALGATIHVETPDLIYTHDACGLLSLELPEDVTGISIFSDSQLDCGLLPLVEQDAVAVIYWLCPGSCL